MRGFTRKKSLVDLAILCFVFIDIALAMSSSISAIDGGRQCFFEMSVQDCNGKLEKGCQLRVYELDASSSDEKASLMFTVDRHTGLVCFKNLSSNCVFMSQSTPNTKLKIVIKARNQNAKSATNFTRTILSVIVDISGVCNLQALATDPFYDIQRFVIGLKIEKVWVRVKAAYLEHHACLAANTVIAHLRHHVPKCVRNQCETVYQLSTGEHFAEIIDGTLRTSREICSFDSLSDAKIVLHLWCKHSSRIHSQSLPFIVHLVSSYQNQDSAVQGSQSVSLRTRLRRAPPVNNPPVFSQQLYTEHVPEEQLAGTLVAVVTATDPDSGEAGRLAYSLVATKDGRSQAMFSIDQLTGTVSTAQPLDRETMQVHYFKVVARDAGKPIRSSETRLTIYVEDINDHTPKFESDHYVKSVSESIGIGSTVQNVRASDEDWGRNSEIVYSFINPGDIVNVFDIDPQLGSITTVSALDRESVDSYHLVIAAVDNAIDVDGRRTATAIVDVTVLDENDNRPQFESSNYYVEVREDVDPSMLPVIANIRATDRDESVNGIVRYSIASWNYGGTFAIDSQTGALSVTAPLNFEQTKQYVLTIRAQDSGSPPAANTTVVNVRVIDVNDNTPKFYAQLYQASISEDAVVGTLVVKVQAYDADSGLNGKISYVIMDSLPDNALSIDRDTGVVTTVGPLDREKFARYSFRVEATDGGDPARTATANVEITVRDVNDNAPVFDPNVYRETVSEDSSPGLLVVMVTAVDTDDDENARITYSIQSGNERGSFAIIGQVGYGTISVARPLSHRQQNHYALTVIATDGLHSDTATVYINVTGANLHRPEFRGTPYHVRVAEDAAVGLAVYNVSAIDMDSGENARLTYTMVDNEAFRIDPVTGDIIVKQPLDRERVAGYSLSVTASDHGRPVKSDTADIDVVVMDVNDNAPKFSKSEYTGYVSEDAFIGISVLTLVALDDDVGINSRVRYSFDGIVDDFTIEPTLGTIRTGRELDRERIERYVLTALAVDCGSPERTTSVTVIINVEDVNDNAPQFETSNVFMTINENSPIGSTVGSLVAHDTDQGENAIVEYAIVGGADSDFFDLTVVNDTAIITTLIELDFEADKHDYVVQVQAQSDHLLSVAVVRILVEDVNDNAPVLSSFVIVFNNFKDHFQSGIVGRVPARDPDVNDKLKYRFVSGNQASMLHLDEDSGTIRLDARLNSDQPTNGTLLVSVTDGINEVQSTCRLYIRLITDDMLSNSVTVRLNNVNRATFLSPLYHLFVSAVAGVVPTTEDSVYMLSILDDTEVVGRRVLNVSFSVRRKVDRLGKDIFYHPQFLREKVYLQRALLTKLSTLEVLPFDDNLCIREPCLNFEECISVQRFGNASDVVSTDAMLFRPLQLSSTFACRCPRGFTGMQSEYLCDTEVNLCYSSPCANNGTCFQREGGYVCHCPPEVTGSHCETDLRHNCSADVCRGGSICVPLIRGGFRCERCDSDAGGLAVDPAGWRIGSTVAGLSSSDGSSPYRRCVECSLLSATRNEFCELRSRSFTRGSFLMFAPLKQRHRFNIRLSVATRENNALLFYNGRYNDKHDFVALEIVDGVVQLSFSLGTDVTQVTARPADGGDINDGQWHEITVIYINRTATLVVGSSCDVELSVKYGEKIGNYSCAGRATQLLDSRCLDVTETCHRFLDLTGPFQLGGLPSSLPVDHVAVRNSHFVGCLRDMYIDGQFVDMGSFAWSNGTQEGCPQKVNFCQSSPCQNAGTCTDAWNTYHCECMNDWSGKDCSQSAIGNTWRLQGQGYILFVKEVHGLADVRLPWLNAFSFRTRQPNANLINIELGAGTNENPKIRLVVRIENGTIQYVLPQKTIVLSGFVSDGKWHHLEARWRSGEVVLSLDYGQLQVTSLVESIVGQSVGGIVIGGHLSGVGTPVVAVQDGFNGCVKMIRVGIAPGVLLLNPEINKNVVSGCSVDRMCSVRGAISCPKDSSSCVDSWASARCECSAGRVGSKCEKVCERYNPCSSGATGCSDSASGYTCQCDPHHTGRYCEQPVHQTCPASWWGSPICGPCNCPKDRGFDPSCNKTTGQCNCRLYHYRVKDTCYPCDCYERGSSGRTCDMSTGQCHCRNGVIGRRCDLCASRFAEVTSTGCQVVYDACPRSFRADIWWERTFFGSVARQECPSGASGAAIRYCNGTDGWLEPDLSDCTSASFVELKSQLAALETRQLEINTFVAKSLMTRLNDATRAVTSSPGRLHENDVDVSARIITQVLQYEARQTGLNLTHTQDRNFIQHVVNSAGIIMDTKYKDIWQRRQLLQRPSLTQLMVAIENYTLTLARNMLQTFTQPFDFVHDNIVIGLDYIASGNYSIVPLPKYNNKVQNPDIFDPTTRATLPMRMLVGTDAKSVVFNGNKLAAITSYALYKTIGELMHPTYQSAVRLGPPNIPTVVNSAVFTLNVIDANSLQHIFPTEPVTFEFRQLVSVNRSNPQCVYWSRGDDRSSNGLWSNVGCQMVSQSDQLSYKQVRCQCNHLSTFAIVMDVSEDEHAQIKPFAMEIYTYAGLGVSLLCLGTAFSLFWLVSSVGGVDTNANTIHMNLVMSLFLANAAFLIGINRVELRFEVMCTLTAIILHYFFLCSFAWMFVESLHVYRRMTDIHDVNHGPMRFYYVVGYVIPGIIVGLSVGLSTDDYGNSESCWLRLRDPLIWSFIGPVGCIVMLNVIVFITAWCASCQGQIKHADVDSNLLKDGLRAAMILLPLMTLATAFALLCVNYTDIVPFHYLFISFTGLQSIFIIIAYVALGKEMVQHLRKTWHRMHASADITDRDQCIPPASDYSPAMSIDGGLNSGHVSSSSSTSHSFGKVVTGGSSRPSHRLRANLSPSTSKKRHVHGNSSPSNELDSGQVAQKRPTVDDSDSDTEGEDARLELASSHSSEDDFDEPNVREPKRWPKASNKQPAGRGKKSSKNSKHTSPNPNRQRFGSPSTSQPRVSPSVRKEYVIAEVITPKGNSSSSSESA